MTNLRKEIEGLIFSAGEPVAIERLAKFLKIKKSECEATLKELDDFYREHNAGLQLIYKDKHVQMTSQSNLGEQVRKFLNKELQEDLSNATLEVLAIVAYRGPLTRVQIDHIRGVNSSFALRNLAIRGLVDRQENPNDSRSYLYEASFEFLKSVGMTAVDNLPEYENLHQASIPQLAEISEAEMKKPVVEIN